MTRALALLLLVAPGAARGQATPAGLPTPLPPGLRVEHAAVVVDLRPLATPGPPVAKAVLVLVNPTPAPLPWTLDALAAPAGASEAALDGRPLAAEARGPQAGPPLWRTAGTTPDPRGAEPLALALAETARGLRWTAAVPPGRHELRLRLALAPGESGRARQVAYSLAPARLWPGLAQLDLAVEAPEGWAVASSLPLRAESPTRLVGRFASVPGDAFALTAVPPRRGPGPVLWLALGAALAALAAALVARRRRTA